MSPIGDICVVADLVAIGDQREPERPDYFNSVYFGS